MFTRLLWEECTFDLRRFVPVVFHAVVHARPVLIKVLEEHCPLPLFGQPDLAVFGVLSAGSGVEMGRLDAAAAVAQMEYDLACRDLPSAHFVGDAVGFAGFAVQLQRAISIGIQTMPPDEAGAIKGYLVI